MKRNKLLIFLIVSVLRTHPWCHQKEARKKTKKKFEKKNIIWYREIRQLVGVVIQLPLIPRNLSRYRFIRIPFLYPAHSISGYMTTLIPFARCHRSQTRFSMTGTSTACRVFGLSLDPGFSAPQPAAHPNFPRKSSFFSGKQIGAENKTMIKARILFRMWKFTNVRHIVNGTLELQHGNVKAICLRCEFKVRMDANLAHAKSVGWQRLHCRVNDVIAWDNNSKWWP